jgi:transcriptional regulator with XRE-family HTH domain
LYVRFKRQLIEERDAVVERLREFLHLSYMTGTEVAGRIGVRAETLYAWLKGESLPNSPERIAAFLELDAGRLVARGALAFIIGALHPISGWNRSKRLPKM